MNGIFKKNITLQTDKILIRPTIYQDYEGFMQIAFNPDIWKYTVGRIYDEKDLHEYLKKAIKDREKYVRIPFTITDKPSHRIAGSTSFGNISEVDKRLEIGWTWLAPEFQGTGLNKGCKYLLLKYAFDELNYERVEFKTDALNVQCIKALKNIGATQECTLRSHTLMHDGRRRDTVYFSILKAEWPELKTTIFKEFQKD